MKQFSKWIREDLAKSGLEESMIEEMGISEVPREPNIAKSVLKEDLKFFRYDGGPISVQRDSYLIPYHLKDANGNGFSRLKLSEQLNGAKYLSAWGTKSRLYVLPGEKHKLDSLKRPLFIVEGEKKAAKLAQELRRIDQDLCCVVGLPGSNTWKKMQDWHDGSVRLSGREIVIVYDMDLEENSETQQQLLGLFLFLRTRNPGSLRVLTWDRKAGKGIDDFYVSQEETRNPIEITAELLENAITNPFKLLDLISINKLPEVIAKADYNNIEAGFLFDEFEFKKTLGITKGDYTESMRNARRKQREREKKAKYESKNESLKNKGLPMIEIEGGKLSEIVDQAEDILCAYGDLYQRAGYIVKLSRVPEIKGINRDSETLIIRPMDATCLTEILTKYGTWTKKDKDGIPKEIDCPRTIAETYLARGEWKLPVLSSICYSPIILMDGRIIDTPGYDKETGIFFVFSKNLMKIPEKPDKTDALHSLRQIKNLIADFPFVEPYNESVALSWLFTCVLRRTLKTAPMHGFSATKMASGKTLLSNIGSLISTGNQATMISHPTNTEEEKKILFSLLLSGDSAIVIDNIERPLASGSLCTILTEEKWSERILGESRKESLSTSASFAATGNNLKFRGDLTTRSIICLLDAECERPEEREFALNIPEHLERHRELYVMDIITIMKAFYDIGRPQGTLKKFARFEDWSKTIRAALVWLGEDDPCKSRIQIEAEDPERVKLLGVLYAWRSAYGDKEKTMQDVKKDFDYSEVSEPIKNLYDAFSESITKLSLQSMGWFFSKHSGRIEGGMQIKKVKKTNKGQLWRVITKELQDSQEVTEKLTRNEIISQEIERVKTILGGKK